jgi:protein-tyrosine-phosphatase
MAKILFVCTGNVFRSMTAEFAVRAALPPGGGAGLEIESAGVEGGRSPLRGDVRSHLRDCGIDVSAHTPRLLTQELVDSADLVVAMDEDHQHYLRDKFNRAAPLFMEICYGRAEGVPDLPEIIPDYKNKPQLSAVFVASTIDNIIASARDFLDNLPRFLPAGSKKPGLP